MRVIITGSLLLLTVSMILLFIACNGDPPIVPPSNYPPVIESMVSSPPMLLPGYAAVLTCISSDVEDDSLSYMWSADGGSFPGGNTDSTVTWQAPSDTGVYIITVEVTDGISTITGQLPIGVSITGTFEIALFDTTFSVTDIIDYTTDPPPEDSVGCWVSENAENYTLNYGGLIDRTVNQDSLYLDAINLYNELNIFTSVSVSFSVDNEFLHNELIPDILPGTYPNITAFDIEPDTILIELEEFEWVILEAGHSGDTNHVSLQVTNNLAIPFYGLNVTLKTANDNLVLLQTIFQNNINPGGSENVLIPLPTDVSIENEGYLIVSGHSDGSSTPVTIEEEDKLDVNLDFRPLVPSSISMHVPSQSMDTLLYFGIEGKDEIIEAVIEEAIADYSFVNNTGLYLLITFTIPDLQNPVGEPFTDNINLPPYAVTDTTGMDISNYTLSPNNNLLYLSMVINIIDSNNPVYYPSGGMVEINSDDTIDMNFDFYNPDEPGGAVSLSHFEVNFSYRTYESEPFMLEIEDVPEGLVHTDFANADLNLNIWSTFGFELPLELELHGYKFGNLQATGYASCLLQAGTLSNPVLSSFIKDGFEDVIGAIPDRLMMTGRYHIGGDIAVNAEDYNGAYFEGKYLLSAPFSLQFNMDGVSVNTEDFSLTEGYSDLLESIELTLDMENHLPSGGEALVISGYAGLDTTFQDTILQISIPQAELDENGFVVNPGIQSGVHPVSQESLDFLATASSVYSLYIRGELIFDSGGSIVNIAPDDYFRISGSMSLTLDN